MGTILQNKKVWLLGGIAVLIVSLIYFSAVKPFRAGAVAVVIDDARCETATATSTLTYMTWGAATTTLTCIIGNDAAQTAVLSLQVNASSTNSIFNLFAEESMDGTDWYQISFNQSASTTNPFNLTDEGSATLTFASSTIGAKATGDDGNHLGQAGGNNRGNYLLDIPVRLNRVRVHAALGTTTGPTGPLNGAVWMQILPKKEL